MKKALAFFQNSVNQQLEADPVKKRLAVAAQENHRRIVRENKIRVAQGIKFAPAYIQRKANDIATSFEQNAIVQNTNLEIEVLYEPENHQPKIPGRANSQPSIQKPQPPKKLAPSKILPTIPNAEQINIINKKTIEEPKQKELDSNAFVQKYITNQEEIEAANSFNQMILSLARNSSTTADIQTTSKPQITPISQSANAATLEPSPKSAPSDPLAVFRRGRRRANLK